MITLNISLLKGLTSGGATVNKAALRNTLATLILAGLLSLSCLQAMAQSGYWQQRINYVMDVDLNVTTNLVQGRQTITYTNNSPETLPRLFMHLYWNAFAPGTSMDEHSRSTENLVVGKTPKGDTILDFDRRFQMRMADMTPQEQGWQHVTAVKINGRVQKFIEHETILEIILEKPMAPKQTLVLTTEFNAQVPKMCRRTGRDSKQTIRYSMGQWYPKMAEFDTEGWHADDYVAREFYGVWGDFDVTIRLDKTYKLGGTGILQNANEIGWGYDKEGTPLKEIAGDKRSWHFTGKNIHDFAWAADPDYKHLVRNVSGNRKLHVIYKTEDEKWKAVADSAVMIMPFLEKTYGAYAYPQYSFIHAGGGATEYPMCTLMNTPSFGTAVHEWCHSWYQMMLGTNENLYAWMDEGFGSYAEDRAMAWLHQQKKYPFTDGYNSYLNFAKGRFNEPMSTHANFFATNTAYNQNSYNKGEVYMAQLGYIIGSASLDKTLLEYYRQWRFKHPEPNDFLRVAEKTSGMELHWYHNYFTNTTKQIDYAIDSLWSDSGTTFIRINRLGEIPMPLDVQLSFKDSTSQLHYVPLSLTFGNKPAEDSADRKVYPAQRWTNKTIIISTTKKLSDLLTVEIDPSMTLADSDRKNNKVELKW